MKILENQKYDEEDQSLRNQLNYSLRNGTDYEKELYQLWLRDVKNEYEIEQSLIRE